jgi:hypothetical protein
MPKLKHWIIKSLVHFPHTCLELSNYCLLEINLNVRKCAPFG